MSGSVEEIEEVERSKGLEILKLNAHRVQGIRIKLRRRYNFQFMELAFTQAAAMDGQHEKDNLVDLIDCVLSSQDPFDIVMRVFAQRERAFEIETEIKDTQYFRERIREAEEDPNKRLDVQKLIMRLINNLIAVRRAPDLATKEIFRVLSAQEDFGKAVIGRGEGYRVGEYLIKLSLKNVIKKVMGAGMNGQR